MIKLEQFVPEVKIQPQKSPKQVLEQLLSANGIEAVSMYYNFDSFEAASREFGPFDEDENIDLIEAFYTSNIVNKIKISQYELWGYDQHKTQGYKDMLLCSDGDETVYILLHNFGELTITEEGGGGEDDY